jgi:hypothetical protein
MKNLSLSADRKTLDATLDTISPGHRLHLSNGHNGKMRYKKSYSHHITVLSEVHLYTAGDNKAAIGSRYTLPLDQVQKIEVIEKDKKRTTSSYVIGAIGAIGATAEAFALVVGSVLEN